MPRFRVPRSKAAWLRERQTIRRQLRGLLGALPPRPARPRVTLVSERARRDARVFHLRIDNAAGAAIPAYLVLPRTATRQRPAPALLYNHWHGDEYAIGKDEIFRSEHTPVEPASALVQAGYAILAIDAYGFGERRGLGPGGPDEVNAAEELSASKLNLWLGRTLWGMMLRDDLIALDYLASRPEVDAHRIGAVGISMGATRTWWLMALDDRIAAGVAIACLTRYQALVRRGHLAAHGLYYYVPGVLAHFDTEAIVSLVAPRPLLCLTGDDDEGSPIEGVRAIGRDVRRVYRLYKEEPHFQSRIYPGVGHVCLPDMWTRMNRWLEKFLRGPRG